MIHLTILSRPDCHLCLVALKIARRLRDETPFSLSYVNVDEDPQLAARYGTRIPIVLIDDIEACAGRITEGQLRRAVKRARWRRPISRILSRFGLTPKRG